MEKINTFIKENIFHILIIIAGTILMLIPAFHSNIWFDESYSVGIVTHSFVDIWKIGSHDVHPILYYWMLKVVSLLFGSNIIIYRLFSIVPVIITAILGMTHISKDFGKKVGMLFTFFILFMPAVLQYSIEIRMYTWTMLFVTVAFIYLNRFITNKNKKSLIIFGLFSLMSCYMHYYALICMGLVNFALVIYMIKNRKETSKGINKIFILTETAQVILYIPWLIAFIQQLISVSGGFWITLTFPDTLINVLNFQYLGTLNATFALVLASILAIYMIVLIIKSIRRKEEYKKGLIPLITYIAVILVALIVSLIASPVLYERYLFTITGLLVFGMAYFIAREQRKIVIVSICSVIMIMSVVNMVYVVQENYDYTNIKPVEYLEKNVSEDDIIIYTRIGVGGIVATTNSNQNQYFINSEYWGIEEAYKAYLPNMEVAYDFKTLIGNCNGKIIIVDDLHSDFYNEISQIEDLKIVDSVVFEAEYKETGYKITIFEKINKEV